MKLTITSLILLFGAAYCSQLACPPGYTLVLEKCLMVNQTPLTHLQAENVCVYTGGTLVNVRTAIETRAVAQFAANQGVNKTWIGLFCFDNNQPSSCYYDDNLGTSYSYNNFAAGYPLVDGIYGGCVYMTTSDGKWISVKCEAESLASICEVPVTVYDPSCKYNYNGFCYLPSFDLAYTANTFADAQKYCETKNGALVSIHSKREVDYIKSIYRGQTSIRNVIIGAQQVYPNVFSWIDGSGSFEKFDYRDPMDTSTQLCLRMDVTTGLWSRYTCDAFVDYMCKVPLGTTVIPKVDVEQNPSDFSGCNTTFLMAPGSFTSYGYLSTNPPEPPMYCTWRIVTLGAYKMRLFFTDVSVYNYIYIYDEYGHQIGWTSSKTLTDSRSNIVNVTFQASGRPGYSGFKAVVLPL